MGMMQTLSSSVFLGLMGSWRSFGTATLRGSVWRRAAASRRPMRCLRTKKKQYVLLNIRLLVIKKVSNELLLWLSNVIFFSLQYAKKIHLAISSSWTNCPTDRKKERTKTFKENRRAWINIMSCGVGNWLLAEPQDSDNTAGCWIFSWFCSHFTFNSGCKVVWLAPSL